MDAPVHEHPPAPAGGWWEQMIGRGLVLSHARKTQRVRKPPRNPRGPCDNPWRMTRRQVQVVEALCRVGCRKLIATEMQTSVGMVDGVLSRVRAAMGVRSDVLVALKWTEWRTQYSTTAERQS